MEDQLFSAAPESPAPYVLLSNIYSSEGRWKERARTIKRMREMGVSEETGLSWIEIEKKVQNYVVGDKMHAQSGNIYGVLAELFRHMTAEGYAPNKSSSRKHPTLASAAYRKPLILHSVALDSTENPLRIASIAGHIDFVKEILRRLCQLEGREKKNPVPYAATKGKADVISEMLLACPECVEDMTVQKKTA
nr:pentatricopeptide repeat-containing protein [Quercus suber]